MEGPLMAFCKAIAQAATESQAFAMQGARASS